MPSRQDQLHSYQYSQQRVVAALVTHDADPQRSPMRRAGTTALVSFLLAAIALTAAAIYGVITGESDQAPTDGSKVYVEKGTGAAYVFLKSDGKLHPVLNYTSGLLVADGDSPSADTVSHKAVASAKLGDTLGIAGAPVSLPTRDDLLKGGWSVCTTSVDDANAPLDRPRTTLLVGAQPTGGRAVGNSAEQGLLVSDPAGRLFLIAAHRRFLVPTERANTLLALGYSAAAALPVGAAWLNAIPQGPDLVPPDIPDRGDASPVPQAKAVGDVVTDHQQYAVVLRDGFAPITAMQAKLLLAVYDTHEAFLGTNFASVVGRKSKIKLDDDRPSELPQTRPEIQDAAKVCLTVPADADGNWLRLNPVIPAGTPVTPPQQLNAIAVDAVYLPAGKGALVSSAASPTAPADSGTVSIVTGTGTAYPLASRDLIGKLGYGGVTPRQLPSELVHLLPQGPALDPAKARQVVKTTGS